jgi:hypothetical protein
VPTTTEPTYQARLPAIDSIERGLSNTLSCPIYDDGALVAPASGTVSIYDPTNAAVVDGASVAIANSTATYTYAAPTTLELAEGYRVIWTLSIGGVDHVFRNAAEVVRHRLYNPVTDLDVYRHAPALDPNGNDPITRDTSVDAQLTEAFAIVEQKLRERGRRPHLVFNPSAVRLAVIHCALALKFRSLSHRSGDNYADRAAEHEKLFRGELDTMQLTYAPNDDEQADDDQVGSGIGGVWLV